MDRRHFLKTICASSLLSPLFLSFRTVNNQAHLYLVSNRPQDYLHPLLQDIRKKGLIHGPYFSISDSSPPSLSIKKGLISKNWQYVHSPSQANILISFRKLYHPVKPSFALINQGEILDIRASSLLPLWLELNRHSPRSSLITIVSCRPKKLLFQPGNYVTVFQNGQLSEKIPLRKRISKQYRTKNGSISIQVDHYQASVVQSSCEHQICRLTPPISLAGERIICAPNHFLLEVAGSSLIDTVIG